MKKSKRKGVLWLLLCAVILGAMLAGGCQKAPDPQPDQVVMALQQMIVKGDAKPMADLFGYKTVEDAEKDMFGDDYKDQIVTGLKEQFATMDLELSDDEWKDIYNGIMAMLAKVNFSAQVKEITGTKAVVTAKTGFYDPKDVEAAGNKALESVVAELGEDAMNDPSNMGKFMTAYLKKYFEEIKTLTPAEGEKEFTVDFEKVKTTINGRTRNVWLPKDANAFGMSLSSVALGGM